MASSHARHGATKRDGATLLRVVLVALAFLCLGAVSSLGRHANSTALSGPACAQLDGAVSLVPLPEGPGTSHGETRAVEPTAEEEEEDEKGGTDATFGGWLPGVERHPPIVLWAPAENEGLEPTSLRDVAEGRGPPTS